jgi:hypothetical protein
LVGQCPAFLGFAVFGVVGLGRGVIEQGSHSLAVCLHREKHSTNVGMLDYRYVLGRLGPRFAPLIPLVCVRVRLLVGAFCDGQPFQTHSDPGGIHHREHVAHPLLLLAEQVGDGAIAPVAERDNACRRGVNPEFVFE